MSDRLTKNFKDYSRRVKFIETEVLTIKEVASTWHKHTKTVELAINTARLIAIKKDAEHGKRGGVWLIERDSVIQLWGEPNNVD